MPLQQLDTQLGFQFFDLLRNGGLGNMADISGIIKASCLHNRLKIFHLFGKHPLLSLTLFLIDLMNFCFCIFPERCLSLFSKDLSMLFL